VLGLGLKAECSEELNRALYSLPLRCPNVAQN
jgi:hypothetical protein